MLKVTQLDEWISLSVTGQHVLDVERVSQRAMPSVPTFDPLSLMPERLGGMNFIFDLSLTSYKLLQGFSSLNPQISGSSSLQKVREKAI